MSARYAAMSACIVIYAGNQGGTAGKPRPYIKLGWGFFLQNLTASEDGSKLRLKGSKCDERKIAKHQR